MRTSVRKGLETQEFVRDSLCHLNFFIHSRSVVRHLRISASSQSYIFTFAQSTHAGIILSCVFFSRGFHFAADIQNSRSPRPPIFFVFSFVAFGRNRYSMMRECPILPKPRATVWSNLCTANMLVWSLETRGLAYECIVSSLVTHDLKMGRTFCDKIVIQC